MTQDELFSMFANQDHAGTIHAWSKRDGVKVSSYTDAHASGGRSVAHRLSAHKNGKSVDHVTKLVSEWADLKPGYKLVLRHVTLPWRGHYIFDVWKDRA